MGWNHMCCPVEYLSVVLRSAPARQTASPCYSVLLLESSVHYVHPLLMISSHDNEKRMYLCVLGLSLTLGMYAVYQEYKKSPRSVVACARVCFIIQCVVRCGGLHNAGTLATGLLKQGYSWSSPSSNLERGAGTKYSSEEKIHFMAHDAIWLRSRPCWCVKLMHIGYAILNVLLLHEALTWPLGYSWFTYISFLHDLMNIHFHSTSSRYKRF